MASMLEKINALILGKDSCVLATTDGDIPHCSLMAYMADESGERLYLVTSSASRKYQNIRYHPRVSLLIDTRGDQQRKLTRAVTVTGTCDILQDTAEISRLKAAFVRQHPQLNDFISKGDVAVMCVQIDSFLLLEGPERAHYQILDRRQSIE